MRSFKEKTSREAEAQHLAEQIGRPRRSRIAGGWLGIALSVTMLLAAGLGYMEWSFTGFPDGHLTEFERETRSFSFGALLANSLFGFLGLAYGFGWIRPSRVMTLVLVLAFAVVTVPSVMLPSCPQLPACVQIYEIVTGHVPDDGTGG